MANPQINVQIGAIITPDFQARLNAAARSLDVFGSRAKEVGTILTAAVTVPLLAFGAASIKVFGDIQALQKGLEAVMGSSAGATAEFVKLIQVAKLPGLGLEEAVRGSVSLQAAGFSADEARESLLAFGNALATVGKGKNELNLVILALTQIQNKASGFGQDLRQLTEQLPQLRGALEQAFGTSVSEDIAKLGITGEEVVKKLVREFQKLPPVAGGVKNAFENLEDSVKINLNIFGEALSTNLNLESSLDALSETLSEAARIFQDISPSGQTLILIFAGIAAAIGPLLLGIAGLISILPALGTAFTVATGPIGITVTVIAALVLGLIALVTQTGLSEKATLKQAKAIDIFNVATSQAADATKLISDANSTFGTVSAEATLKLKEAIKAKIEDVRVTLLQAKAANALAVAEAKKESLFDIIVGFGRVQRRVNKVQSEGVDQIVKLNKSLDELSFSYVKIGSVVPIKETVALTDAQNAAIEKARLLAEALAKVQKARVDFAKPLATTKIAQTDFNAAFSPKKIDGTGTGLDFAAQFNLANANLAKAVAGAPGISLKPIEQGEFTKGLQLVQDDFKSFGGDFANAVSVFSSNINLLVRENLASAFTDFGLSIGEALAKGENVINAIGQSLLTSMAKFIGDFGQQLIAVGVAGLAFSSLIETIKLGGPAAIPAAALAIAAGVALTVLAGALRGSVGKGLGGGGGSGSSGVGAGGSGGSFTGSGSNSFDPFRSFKIEVVGEITGEAIGFALAQGQNRKN